ncbi:hypothetical protein A9R05_42460 (plasmid) [Burkholderia sp. KK1]|uniref:hypothetical protein n=1 Tax=Burkholderia sp. M701 TaxID=326454 RepID=UPI0009798D70|nr:hypothetical protein [Burkholderia sp. M701]AQH05684.1 hypothetical protein A9R05_42460 [Burkholderia sp. KK1]
MQLETEEDFAKWGDSLCLFLDSDIEAASRAKWLAQRPTGATASTSANEHAWLRVASPDAVDDVIRAHEGLQAALTELLEDTLEHGTFPDYIELSEKRIRFEFNNEWQDWVELRLAHPDSATCFPEQARYAGVLTGLAASKEAGEAFIKRLGELPGWRGAKLVRPKRSGSDEDEWHAPLPKEWRKISTEILHRVGLSDPTPAQVEEVACAVLDFPTWNHLTAAYKTAVSAPGGVMVYHTCYRADDTVLFEQTHGTIESALHGLVTSVQSTAKLSTGWNELEIAFYQVDGDIAIRAPHSPDKGTWSLTRAFFVNANRAPAALQSWVRRYFDGRPLTVETLNEMFLLSMDDATERSHIAESLCDMTVLAQAGSRRLYKQPPWPRHTGCRLVVHTLSSDGSRTPGFGIPFSSDEASLLVDQTTGHTLLTVNCHAEAFEILTVFSADETEMVSAIRDHLLPEIQKRAEEYLAVMDSRQRKLWNRNLSDASKWMAPQASVRRD